MDIGTWNAGMAFGAMLSATDPVAVVALLKELGAPEQLALGIEGESLFNDGTAAALFLLFAGAMRGEVSSVEEQVAFFFQIALGGSAIGLAVGLLVAAWLVWQRWDPITQVAVTIIAAYTTFIVAEGMMHVSGVLAVVVLGLILAASGRTSIRDHEAMHYFWEMIEFIANTVVFVLAGLLITKRGFLDPLIEWNDWLLLLALYAVLLVVRAVAIAVFWPCLRATGYGLGGREFAVMTWAGLRGAVGLILALQVANNELHGEPQGAIVGHRFLFFMAGITVLTLLVNGTTTGPLVKYLGIGAPTAGKIRMFKRAVAAVERAYAAKRAAMRSDEFFRAVDWNTADGFVLPLLEELTAAASRADKDAQARRAAAGAPLAMTGSSAAPESEPGASAAPDAASDAAGSAGGVAVAKAAAAASPGAGAVKRAATPLSVGGFLCFATRACCERDTSARARSRALHGDAGLCRRCCGRRGASAWTWGSPPPEAADPLDGADGAGVVAKTAGGGCCFSCSRRPSVRSRRTAAVDALPVLSVTGKQHRRGGQADAPSPGPRLARMPSLADALQAAAPDDSSAETDLRDLRQRYIGMVKREYQQALSQGWLSAPAFRVLMEAASSAQDTLDKPMSEWQNVLEELDELSWGAWLQWGFASFCGSADFDRVAHEYELCAGFIQAHLKTRPFLDIIAGGFYKRLLAEEEDAMVAEARVRMEASCQEPAVTRALQTRHAIRVLISKMTQKAELLCEHGEMEAKELEEVVAVLEGAWDAAELCTSIRVDDVSQLREAMFLNQLSEDVIGRLLDARAEVRTLKPGTVLAAQGVKSNTCIVILSGLVNLY
ncbi:NHX7, partial [Symbiodinium sp. KB8]